jgi:hypothetical protein
MPEIGEQVGEVLESAAEGDDNDDEKGGHAKKFNSIVAASVAVSATILAIGNVKAGNVVQAMSVTQMEIVDTWAFYQAKSTKQSLVEASEEQLTLQRDSSSAVTAEERAKYDKAIEAYKSRGARYEKEKSDLQAKVDSLQKQYDALNVKDDQFDIAEALISVGIALFGITALTQKRWLIFVAFAFAGFGAIVSFAGFFGWNVRPEWLVKVVGV